jgi:nitrate/TMAO reductase-like tetraheme cytochrome c subunit
MTAYVDDLRGPGSEGLAAVHYKNRYIRETQCYTCHRDYGLLATVFAKMDGVPHMVHYVRGSYALPLKIAHPFPNVRCLECHGESQKFLKSERHPADTRPQLMSGEMPCMTCHAPAHTPKEAKR